MVERSSFPRFYSYFISANSQHEVKHACGRRKSFQNQLSFSFLFIFNQKHVTHADVKSTKLEGPNHQYHIIL